MADKETGLNITVGAVADEKSAEQAVNKIVKKVDGSVKGGRIEVPVDITVPIDETKSKLTKAQKDITSEISKLMSKGFSASGKEIDALSSKLDKFMKTAREAGKDNRNPIVKAISQQVKDLQNQYKELAKVEKSTKDYQTKTKNSNKPKSRGKKQFSLPSDEEIEANIKQHKNRQYKGVATTGPKGFKTDSGFDTGVATSKTILDTDRGGSYESKWAQQMAKSLADSKKADAKTLTVTIDKELANKMADAAERNGNNKNKFSPEEKAKGIASAILPELAKVLGGIEKGRSDASPEKFFQMLEAVLKLNQDAGVKALNNAMSVLNMTMHKWFNADGTLGVSDGENKIDKTKAPHVEAVLKDMIARIGKLEDKIIAETVAIEEATKVEKEKVKTTTKKTTTSGIAENSIANKVLTDIANSSKEQSQKLNESNKVEKETSKSTQKDYIQTLRESSMERAADTAEAAMNKTRNEELSQDLSTGLNTDTKADKLITEVEKLNGDKKEQKVEFPQEQIQAILANLGKTKTDGKCACQSILEAIRDAVQSINGKITGTVGKEPTKKYVKKKEKSGDDPNVIHLKSAADKALPMVMKTALQPLNQALVKVETALVPVSKVMTDFKYDVPKGATKGSQLSSETNVSKAIPDSYLNLADAQKKREAEQNKTYEGPISRSLISTTLQDPAKAGKTLSDVFARLMNTSANYEKIMAKTSAEQDQMAAARIKEYGLDRSRNATDTGDKSAVARSMSLWRGKDKFEDIFKNLKLTEGVEVDTTKVTEALSKVLAGKEMFNAQTGGTLRNLLGSVTGYIGMDSLEKSRAQADGVNQIMANIRKAMNDVLNDIQRKESAVAGMKESGDLKMGADGRVLAESTTEAKTLVAQLEEQKMVLASILADAGMVDQVVDQTGGKISQIVKQLGFTSPVLRENNTILANINAGLDKNGKALKFQTRTAEVLNYSFQLMARSIGQMIKNWIAMANPITWLKKAFSDFTSYDVKWQRTMNVIKYNLRRIIRPAMEWIAQQIVNIIGLVNALMKGIGKVFNQNWDLFDQSAASAEQMREELEQAANVTASFDELHDISGSTAGGGNPAEDLMGDIYTPQWDGLNELLEKIGTTIGNIIKAVSGFTFWDWLKLAGLALAGYLALKWLLNIFGKGKNPLQTVAEGFSFLEKAVGWALLIWAFTEFTKALTDFVECMKTADWDDIAKALIMLAGAFAALVGGIAGVQGITKLVGSTTGELLGMSALVGVFALFVKAIVPFIECIRDLGDEKVEVISASLLTLAAAFIELIAGVAGVEGITKWIGMTGTELAGLAAVVGAMDLFVAAITPFIKAIGELGDDKWEAIGGMIVGLVGAFIALAAGVGIISRAFSTMDWKAIGQLYAVAGVFEVFMLALIPFINAIKDIPFETLAGGTLLIAGAFLALGGAIALMAPALAMLNWSSFAMGIGLMAAMAGLLWVLSIFVENLQGLTSEQMLSGLLLLAGGLMAITVAIGALAVVFTAVATTGIGIAALALLALILGVVAGIILAIAELVRAMGEAGAGIKLICEGIAQVIQSIGDIIIGVMQIISDFIGNIIDDITELAVTIAHEIGETIRQVIETVGDVIKGIIDSLINAIPKLLQSIVNFCHDIGPAIENSVDAIIRSITKLVNFVVSAVEYICNLVIGAINKFSVQVPDWVPGIGGTKFGFNLQKIDIPRFVPKYETGTNYVPNDGLAYLHRGEAVVPKKYNQPYQPTDNSRLEQSIDRLNQQVAQIGAQVGNGINIKGQFVQKGSDLVAVVRKADKQSSNKLLNDKVYAR